MQQSQKLKAIEYIFNSNKEKEISYYKRHNLIVEDKMTNKYWSTLKEKYKWLDKLEWLHFFNFLSNVRGLTYFFYWILRPNLYSDSWFSKIFWRSWEQGVILNTKFDILDSKKFLHSLLEFIDNEKENLTILKRDEQARELRKEIDKLKGKFEMFKLPLTFNLSKFLSSYVQYYKTLSSLESQYKILDIQIYQWNITFTLSENISNKVDIVFQENDLFIDSKKVFFQRKNTVIFECTKLIFSYFQKHNTYEVQFYELEQYYKNQINLYPQISKVKFNYEYLRKSIETKSREIQGKHHLDKSFLGIDVSWIRCQYLQPENK